MLACVDAESVVAAADVLHERLRGDHDLGCAEGIGAVDGRAARQWFWWSGAWSVQMCVIVVGRTTHRRIYRLWTRRSEARDDFHSVDGLRH
jgi:hypothetical protein